MELRQVRYFVAVAQEGNFGRAAEQLRVAQSGLSQQIRALERSLGAQLLDRTIRPVRLTSEGEVFLDYARQLLELADRSVDGVHAASDRPRTILKFGSSAFGNAPVVDELLRHARERIAGVDIQIQLDIGSHNLAALSRRVLDVVSSYVPFASDDSPRYLRLGWIEVALAIPRDHRLARADRVTRAELYNEPFLLGPRSANPPLADHVNRSLFGQTDPPNPVPLNDLPGRLQLVADGVGITPVSIPTETAVPIPGVAFRRLEDPVPTIEYGLLWFDDHVSPALASFLDLAREIASTTRDDHPTTEAGSASGRRR